MSIRSESRSIAVRVAECCVCWKSLEFTFADAKTVTAVVDSLLRQGWYVRACCDLSQAPLVCPSCRKEVSNAEKEKTS